MALKEEMVMSLVAKATDVFGQIMSKYTDNVSEYEFTLSGVSFEKTPGVFVMNSNTKSTNVAGDVQTREERHEDLASTMKLSIDDFKVRLKMHERINT